MADQQIPVSLFYRAEGYSVGSVSFDLILSEEHEFNNTVTEHPVEDGTPISDHIQNELRTAGLKGLVSNFSLTQGTGEVPFELESLISARRGISSGIIGGGETPPNRAIDAYDQLKILWESRELVTIVTVLEVYENVAITSIRMSRDGDTGDAQEFDISFKQVRVVQLQEKKFSATVKPGPPETQPSRQASKKHDAGRTIGPKTEYTGSTIASAP